MKTVIKFHRNKNDKVNFRNVNCELYSLRKKYLTSQNPKIIIMEFDHCLESILSLELSE